MLTHRMNTLFLRLHEFPPICHGLTASCGAHGEFSSDPEFDHIELIVWLMYSTVLWWLLHYAVSHNETELLQLIRDKRFRGVSFGCVFRCQSWCLWKTRIWVRLAFFLFHSSVTSVWRSTIPDDITGMSWWPHRVHVRCEHHHRLIDITECFSRARSGRDGERARWLEVRSVTTFLSQLGF